MNKLNEKQSPKLSGWQRCGIRSRAGSTAGIALAILMCASSCKKEMDSGSVTSGDSGKAGGSVSADIGYDIMAGNNVNNKLELYNYGDTDWSDSGSLKWSWIPTTGAGYSSTEINLWTNGDPEGDPMDAKLVKTNAWSDCSEVIVAAGGQLATIVKYATSGTKGDRIWAINCGAGSYPHGIELIPNGNVAVAAAHGDWIRVYNTNGTNYANYPLVGAHGVVWDEEIHRLWVVGDTKLTALIIGGTRAAPTLTEDTGRTKTIPGNGHDLSRYEGDNNRLWVTNSNNVYYYTKNDKVLHNAPGSAFRTKVKAVSNNNASSGYMIVETRPNTTACTLNTWCTPTVDFYSSAGSLLGTRTRSGAGFYKADVFYHDNLPAPATPVANGKYIISNVLSGKAMAVYLASMDPEVKIVQATYTSSNPNDEWNVTQIGSTGYYKITNVNSGLGLNVENASWNSTTPLIQYPYTSTTPNNDEWKIVDLGSGQYKIENRMSGLVVNVEAASTADGANIIQYPYSNVGQCKWTFTSIP